MTFNIDIKDINTGNISISSNCAICQTSHTAYVNFPLHDMMRLNNEALCIHCSNKLRAVIAKFDQINRL